MKYKAFLSYSRKDDKSADWLHKRVDSYRTPKSILKNETSGKKIPPSLYPVYRDRSDMSGGGVLSKRLKTVLRNSDNLIVLCSHNAAKSQWVNEEVRLFQELGRSDRIFPVICPNVGDVDDLEAQCFPPALRGKGILAADLRELKPQGGQIIGDGKKTGLLKLLAGLLNIDLTLLVQRDNKRARRINFLFAFAALFFALIATFAVLVSIYANKKSNQASDNLDKSRRVQSEFLMDLSKEASNQGMIVEAIGYALEAVPNGRSSWPYIGKAESVLHEAVMNYERSDFRVLKTVSAHDGDILGLLVSLDNSIFVTWSSDWTAKVWSRSSSEPIQILSHMGPVRGAVLSDLNDKLLTWSVDGNVKVWDLYSGRELNSVQHDSAIYGANYIDENRIVSYSADGQLKITRLDSNNRTIELNHESAVLGIKYLASTSEIITWTKNGTLTLWDVNTGIKNLHHETKNGLKKVALNSNENTLYVSSESLISWNYRTGKVRKIIDPNKRSDLAIGSFGEGPVEFNIDNSLSAIATDENQVSLISLHTGNELSKLQHDYPVRGIKFSKTGKKLATWSTDGVIKVWSTNDQKETLKFYSRDNILNANFLDAEKALIWWTLEGGIVIKDLNTGKEIGRNRHEATVSGTEELPNSEQIISYSSDGEMKFHSYPSVASIQQIGIEGNPARYNFSGTGGLVSECNSKLGKINLYKTENLKLVFKSIDTNFDNGCFFTPDYKSMLTYSKDGKVSIWSQFDKIASFDATPEATHIRTSKSGHRVFLARENHSVALWDTESGDLIREWKIGDIGKFGLIDFSDQGTVLMKGKGGNINLFDYTGTQVGETIGDTKTVVHSLSFDKSILILIRNETELTLVSTLTGQILYQKTFATKIERANLSKNGTKVILRTTAKIAYSLELIEGEYLLIKLPFNNVVGVQMSPNGSDLIISESSDDKKEIISKLYEWNEREYYHQLNQSSSPRIYFLRNSSLLASVGYDKGRSSLEVYDTVNKKVLVSDDLGANLRVLSSSTTNDNLVVIDAFSVITIYDLKSGRIRELRGLAGYSDFQLSPERKFIYSQTSGVFSPHYETFESVVNRANQISMKTSPLSERERCRAYLKLDCDETYSLPIDEQVASKQRYMENHVQNLTDMILVGDNEALGNIDVEVILSANGSINIAYNRPFRANVVRLVLNESTSNLTFVFDDGSRRSAGLSLHPKLVEGIRKVGMSEIVFMVNSTDVTEELRIEENVITDRNGIENYFVNSDSVPIFVVGQN